MKIRDDLKKRAVYRSCIDKVRKSDIDSLKITCVIITIFTFLGCFVEVLTGELSLLKGIIAWVLCSLFFYLIPIIQYIVKGIKGYQLVELFVVEKTYKGCVRDDDSTEYRYVIKDEVGNKFKYSSSFPSPNEFDKIKYKQFNLFICCGKDIVEVITDIGNKYKDIGNDYDLSNL